MSFLMNANRFTFLWCTAVFGNAPVWDISQFVMRIAEFDPPPLSLSLRSFLFWVIPPSFDGWQIWHYDFWLVLPPLLICLNDTLGLILLYFLMQIAPSLTVIELHSKCVIFLLRRLLHKIACPPSYMLLMNTNGVNFLSALIVTKYEISGILEANVI